MHVTSLGHRTDLALLTAAGSTVEDRGTHLVVRTPDNPTYFWGNFILLPSPPVPGGEREVIGAFHTEFPDAEHISIAIDTGELDADARARFEAGGLVVDTSLVLTATALVKPLAPVLPVEIRALESDLDWEGRAYLSQTLYPETPEESFLAFARGKNVQERRLVDAGSGQRFGAFLEGIQIATAAVFRTEPGVARFQSVETHPEFRRQGLAANVVHAAGAYALANLDVTTLVIVADEDGPATGIYQRLGFVDAERTIALEKRSEGWAND